MTMSGQIFKQLFSMVIGIVFARLLTPEDYGIIGMAMVLYSFAAMFNDIGLANATIQKPKITPEQLNSLFWLNVFFSIIVFLFFSISAPLASYFFSQPKLLNVILVLSVIFIFIGSSVQLSAILKRELKFGIIVKIEIVSVILSSVTGLLFIFFIQRNYWALVTVYVSQAFYNAVGTWILSDWRPKFVMNFSSIRHEIKFGLHITGNNIFNYLNRNFEKILIGKLFGEYSLGIYSKAYQMLLKPIQQINFPLTSVMISILSRLNNDDEAYRKIYLTTVSAINLLIFPNVLFVIVVAKSLIFVLLGEQWLDSAEIFAILGFAGLTQGVGNSTGWLYISQGRTKEFFVWGMVINLISIISFILGIPWGVKGIALSWVIATLFIRTPINYYIIGRKGPVNYWDLLQTYKNPAIIGVGGLIPILLLKYFVDFTSVYYSFAVSVLTWIFFYALLSISFKSNREDMITLYRILKRKH